MARSVADLRAEAEAAELASSAARARLRAALSEEEARGGRETKVLGQRHGDDWTVYHGDCVEVLRGLPAESIHYSLFSPPFASLFTYSNSERDMGNCKSDEGFRDHFSYLLPELWRVTKPGRLVSFHCMNLPMTIGKDGAIGIKDFRGDLIRAFVGAGFVHHSEVVVWKDPLNQAVRTKKLELAHKQISKDSARCAMGYPDFIITVRKPGENSEPVAHGRGFERYIGERPEPAAPKRDDPRKNKYSHEVWQRYASPVWFDIRQTDTLNAQAARDHDDERHICPLQLDVVARCLELWTNPGDAVLDPFSGIGTVGYVAVGMGRRYVGVELKDSYFRQSIKNLRRAGRSLRGILP